LDSLNCIKKRKGAFLKINNCYSEFSTASFIAKDDCHFAVLAKTDYISIRGNWAQKTRQKLINFFVNLPFLKHLSKHEVGNK
jgi:hypothetical protein